MGKFLNLFVVLFSFYLNFSSADNSCAIEKSKRLRCGPRDITQDACENIRCCYSNVDGNSECFFSTDSAPRFSIWSSWNECSESCGGGGTTRRERACLYEGGHQAPDELCLGSSFETKSCNTHRCGEEKEEPSTCIERFTARCEERRSECASNKDLQRDCPLTCNTCQQPQTVNPTNAPPTKRECRDISPTCGTAKELCFRGFLSDTFRKWCRKTCNNCEEGTIIDTISPAVTTESTPAPTAPPTQHPLSVCVDEFKTCDRVASLCTLPKYRRELTIYCRRTCNLCFVEPRATTMPGATTKAAAVITDAPVEDTCVDKAPNCANWQQLCGTNSHVNNLCQKSCGLCGAGESDEVESQGSGYLQTATTAKPQTVTTAAATNDLVEVCKDQVSEDRCNALKSLCPYHSQTRQLCAKTCGECSSTGEAVADQAKAAVATSETTTTQATTIPTKIEVTTVPTKVEVTTVPTTTVPTTAVPTTALPTTTAEATTVSTTTSEVTTTQILAVVQPKPGCADRYKNCRTIKRHCDIKSYRETLRKHCAFTCNIDNCRGL